MAVNVYFRVVNEKTKPIIKKLREFRYEDITLWFSKGNEDPDSIRKYSGIKIIEDSCVVDNDLNYISWDVHSYYGEANQCGLKNLLWRMKEYDSTFVIIDDCKHEHNQRVFFIDAVHEKKYPDVFYKIPCFCELDDFFKYCDECEIFSFSLKDTTKFAKAVGITPYDGAIVYKEIVTNRYWYLDMFHKTHYEVFDSTGRMHIGEANLEGELDTAKKDPQKRLRIQ